MNLHSIVGPIVGAVSPPLLLSIQTSDGYTTNADGSQSPTYNAAVQMYGDVQALQFGDLRQAEGLNVQGERRAIYLNGNFQGVVRPLVRGGDLVTFPDGTIWLVAFVFEDWYSVDGWQKICVTLQNNS